MPADLGPAARPRPIESREARMTATDQTTADARRILDAALRGADVQAVFPQPAEAAPAYDAGDAAPGTTYRKLPTQADLASRNATLRQVAVDAADHAEQIEGELAQAIRDRDFARTEAKSIYDTCKTIERERNQALADLAALQPLIAAAKALAKSPATLRATFGAPGEALNAAIAALPARPGSARDRAQESPAPDEMLHAAAHHAMEAAAARLKPHATEPYGDLCMGPKRAALIAVDAAAPILLAAGRRQALAEYAAQAGPGRAQGDDLADRLAGRLADALGRLTDNGDGTWTGQYPSTDVDRWRELLAEHADRAGGERAEGLPAAGQPLCHDCSVCRAGQEG